MTKEHHLQLEIVMVYTLEHINLSVNIPLNISIYFRYNFRHINLQYYIYIIQLKIIFLNLSLNHQYSNQSFDISLISMSLPYKLLNLSFLHLSKISHHPESFPILYSPFLIMSSKLLLSEIRTHFK